MIKRLKIRKQWRYIYILNFLLISKVLICPKQNQRVYKTRFVHAMKIMKFRLFIFLLGVCLLDLTGAKKKGNHGSRRETIVENGTLIHVEMTNSTHINLSNRSIDHVLYSAFSSIDVSNVTSLDLSHNNLDYSHVDIIGVFYNLEKLFLSHNKLTRFPSYDGELDKLKYLDISSNPVTESLYLDRFFLKSLPASTKIYIGADKIFPSGPVTPQFDHKENYDWQRDTPRSRVDKNLKIKLCKTVDGLVKSVEELKVNETLDDCMIVNVLVVGRAIKILDLSNLGLRKFERNWYKLENHDIMSLNLYNNTITDITPELLNDLPSDIGSIDLGYNNITIIQNNTINNRNIKVIFLDYNGISIIEDSAFKNTDLKALILQRNRLNDLLFVKTLPSDISLLVLSYNSFPIISANTFQGFKELRELHLSECHIETIESGAFENLENLEIIHMESNRISELKPGLFRGVKELMSVDLSFNRIKQIPRDIFSGIKNMHMYYINLDNNQINTIEVGSFTNWTIDNMNLEVNKITEESVTKAVFEGCSVMKLNLGDNLISEINESFLNIPALNSLNLRRNRIRSIKKDFFKNMPGITELDLSQNPLNHLEKDVFHQLVSEWEMDININLSRVPIEYLEAGIFGDEL